MRVVSEGPVKITKATIEKAWRKRAEGNRTFIRDGECRGLALVVNPTSMRWEYAYRPRGLHPLTGRRWPNRTVSLGTPDSLSIEEARSEAGRIKGEVLIGGDPLAERRAAAEARKAAVVTAAAEAAEAAFTFSKLVDAWEAARAGDRRASYLAVATGALKRHLAEWKERAASGITTAEAVRVLDDIKESAGPVASNRALSYGRAAYGWAVKRQMLARNPFVGIEAPSRDRARDRVLSSDEVGAIWRAAGCLTGSYSAFVRVLLLTLQRRDEVAALRWDELSPDLTTWTLPAARAKNGRAHVIHLAEPVQVILKALPKHKACPYVFPANSGKPVSSFSLSKRKIDAAIANERSEAEIEQADMAGWTMHDFRRAGVTGLAGMGFAPHVCDRLLNHVTGTIRGVAAVYQRAEFLPERRAALDAWASLVLRAAEGTAGRDDKVVTLRRGAG
jgi:integrase